MRFVPIPFFRFHSPLRQYTAARGVKLNPFGNPPLAAGLFIPILFALPCLLLLTSFPASAQAPATSSSSPEELSYDARTSGREILTPLPPTTPVLTGATIFGVRPGKPIRFHISATGENPMIFSAAGLPPGVTLDSQSGWISGRAPKEAVKLVVKVEAKNSQGTATRDITLAVGDTICLTPPMGWNSWYVYSEGVSEKAIRETATALKDKGLADHGWTYLNIDDCWSGLRDPQTKALQPNGNFGGMKALADFVNAQGLKLGIYSSPWMSTYAGFIGGSAPNEQGDYTELFVPEDKRANPFQVFGRYPNCISKGLAKVGPVWMIDKDARQFADWGIDYVKYDWKDWTLVSTAKGYNLDKTMPKRKSQDTARHVHDDYQAVDRDIVLSFSPNHDSVEDGFVPTDCNLWRLTGDISAKWNRLIVPFTLAERLNLTRPGHYGDLDMLQIGPMGKPNRAETTFKPSPLQPNEQYFQVTLWSMLTQPLLISCHVPSMDDFDLNLVTNDEVLAVDYDALCKQGYRIANQAGDWEIWGKDLADGSKAVGFFNLSDKDQTLTVSKDQLAMTGSVRDLWRQKEIGPLKEKLSIMVSSHGAALVKVTPQKP